MLIKKIILGEIKKIPKEGPKFEDYESFTEINLKTDEERKKIIEEHSGRMVLIKTKHSEPYYMKGVIRFNPEIEEYYEFKRKGKREKVYEYRNLCSILIPEIGQVNKT